MGYDGDLGDLCRLRCARLSSTMGGKAPKPGSSHPTTTVISKLPNPRGSIGDDRPNQWLQRMPLAFAADSSSTCTPIRPLKSRWCMPIDYFASNNATAHPGEYSHGKIVTFPSPHHVGSRHDTHRSGHTQGRRHYGGVLDVTSPYTNIHAIAKSCNKVDPHSHSRTNNGVIGVPASPSHTIDGSPPCDAASAASLNNAMICNPAAVT